MRRPATKSKPISPLTADPAAARSRVPAWLLVGLLVLVTVVLYWPATRHDFINYDDDQYVLENTHVTSGLTLENVRWAFGSGYAYNWHPVTWLSHMLDCQMFGLKPWGHHLTSVLLHALNAALVFLFLRCLTGAFWRSAMVAAVFAVHPLHVESVAWVAERKDVLSACFGLMALIFYAKHVRKAESRNRKAEIGRAAPSSTFHLPSSPHYWLALLLFSLGLMSKPMLVTWPFVMLLLDYWPLKRVSSFEFRVSSWGRLVWEKIPFFALAAASSVVTFVVQKHVDVVAAAENLPLLARSGNALISYCRYLGKIFWPANLAVFYPHPGHWPWVNVLGAGVVLFGLTIFFFIVRRRYPFLLMGWLWFVGTLVPVIGLVQVGDQAMADRYAYIPSLGLLIAVVWGACELTGGWRSRAIVLSLTGSAAIILCAALTRQQLGYWKDSETLFRHALAVAGNSYTANSNLGDALAKQGRLDEAISCYRETLRLEPDSPKSQYNLGVVVAAKGLPDEAINYYREAIRLKPDYAEALYNLGVILGKQGRTDEAIAYYREALRFKPDHADAHNNLGIALGRQGQIDEAMTHFQEAVRLKPDYADAHNNLGITFSRQGRAEEAISQYREAIRLQPDYANAYNNLANVFLKQGRIDEAVAQYQEALRLKPENTDARDNLARALEMKNPPAGR